MQASHRQPATMKMLAARIPGRKGFYNIKPLDVPLCLQNCVPMWLFSLIFCLATFLSLKKLQGCEHPEEISLVICDQCMPGMTGVKLFKELANNQIMPDTVRIILTGYNDNEVMREGINEAYIFKFVLKPYNPDELRLIVRDAMESFYRQELKQCRYDIDERDIEIAKLKKELENLKVKYNALSQK
jgi:response regulator RpfG family c-di-GMP phosphodiesterase